MTPPTWLILVSMLVGISSGVLGVWWSGKREAREREKWREDQERRAEALAKRVCREFTSSDEWSAARDRRIDERIDMQFAARSRSFVDRVEFERHEEEQLRRFEKLDRSIAEMTRLVGELDGKISTQVASQVAAQLIPILTQKVILGGTTKPGG